jgi:hypothetical protein
MICANCGEPIVQDTGNRLWLIKDGGRTSAALYCTGMSMFGFHTPQGS